MLLCPGLELRATVGAQCAQVVKQLLTGLSGAAQRRASRKHIAICAHLGAGGPPRPSVPKERAFDRPDLLRA